MRCVVHVARVGEERTVYMVLVGRPERKKPFGRPRRRWEEEMKLHLREIGWQCVWGRFVWLGIGTDGGLL
jgi:hypothetical protein